MYAADVSLAAGRPWPCMPKCNMAILLTSFFFVFKISFLPNRPVKLWFDPKQIATETISPVLIQEISPEHHIKNII